MPEPSALDQLADAFWERFKQLSPISATINGDARYDDRLPDPEPRGPRRRAGSSPRTCATPRSAIPDEGLGVEDRITRDVLRVIGEIFIVQDDQRIDTLQVVDQMGGPQTMLPQLCQFQQADTPERLELFLARLHAYPEVHGRQPRACSARALASGLTAPRIVAERTIAQLERMLATPIDEAVVPSLVTVAREEDRETIRDVIRDEVYPGRRRVPRGAQGRLPRGDPAGERHLVGAQRRRAVPHPDPALDDARPRPRRGPPDRARRARPDRGERRVDRRARRASATTRGRIAPRSPPTPTTRPSRAAMPSSPARTRTSSAPRAAAGSMFRRVPVSGCRVIPVEEYKERDAPFAYYYPPSADTTRPGHVLRQHVRPAVADLLAPRDDHVPRGDPGPPLPDRAREREHGAQHASGASPLATPAARTSRAGACTPSGWPTRWACTATRPSGSACSTRRRGAPPASSSTPGCTPCAGPASSRSTCSSQAGLTETDAVIETDRYIAWPGQALTYKVGQREIERLRREITARDGDGVRPPGVPRPAARPRLAAAGDPRHASCPSGCPRPSDGR